MSYLFETYYAVAIEPKRNISDNPGCEWQLKYFGNGCWSLKLKS